MPKPPLAAARLPASIRRAIIWSCGSSVEVNVAPPGRAVVIVRRETESSNNWSAAVLVMAVFSSAAGVDGVFGHAGVSLGLQVVIGQAEDVGQRRQPARAAGRRPGRAKSRRRWKRNTAKRCCRLRTCWRPARVTTAKSARRAGRHSADRRSARPSRWSAAGREWRFAIALPGRRAKKAAAACAKCRRDIARG